VEALGQVDSVPYAKLDEPKDVERGEGDPIVDEGCETGA